MAAPERASLLGLPVEIRLQIYDYVCQLAPDPRGLITETTNIRHSLNTRGAWRGPYCGIKSPARLGIPWIQLLSCCTTIAAELKQYMEGPAYLAKEHSRTFIVDISDHNKSLAWQKIPCRPHQAQTLVVNPRSLNDTENALWLVYQFVRCGPMFDWSRPIAEPPVLDELLVNVHDEVPGSVEDLRGSIQRIDLATIERFYERICDSVHTWNKRGEFEGVVKQIRVRSISRMEERLEGAVLLPGGLTVDDEFEMVIRCQTK